MNNFKYGGLVLQTQNDVINLKNQLANLEAT